MVERRELPKNRNITVVAQTVLSNGYMVSTIVLDNPLVSMMDSFIGDSLVDDGRADLSTPGSYETMVFDYDWEEDEVKSWRERDFERYSTVEKAREGHEAMVKKWIKGGE